MNKFELRRAQSVTLIREVALRLFAENGFEKTTIRMIANEANMAIGLMYNYYSSKEEVKKEILEYCVSARTRDQILTFIQVEVKPYNFKKFISRLFDDRYLQHTIPHNPRATNQQYMTTKKGQAYLRALAG